jgi:hypothetical protein
MVFNKTFDFAGHSAGLFSVTHGPRARPGADPDRFEEATEGAFDDRSTSLSADAIHGATSRAKTVQEQSPEARIIMGFLGSFVEKTQTAAGTEGFAQDLGSVSTTASDGMAQSRTTVENDPGLTKNGDLRSEPDKGKYSGMPKTPAKPEAPAAGNAPKATAEKPDKPSTSQ